MPAKIKRSPQGKRVSRRPLSTAEKLALLRVAPLGREPGEAKPTSADKAAPVAEIGTVTTLIAKRDEIEAAITNYERRLEQAGADLSHSRSLRHVTSRVERVPMSICTGCSLAARCDCVRKLSRAAQRQSCP